MSRCAECRAPLIHDIESGEMVCCKCGIVARENMPDPETAPLGLFDDKGTRLPRVSGQVTLARHDNGMLTAIAPGGTDFSGNIIERVTQSKMVKLRKWQNRIRINNNADRRAFDILKQITDICSALSLPKTVLETSSLTYRSLSTATDLKNKSTVGLACVMVFMGCKKCEALRSMQEIVSAACPPKEVRLKTKLANRYYRTLVLATGNPRSEPIPLDKYISKISNLAESGGRAERLALQLAHKTKNKYITNGRDPNGLASAYLCIASMLLNVNNAQRDISEASGVTDVTVRCRSKEILSMYDIRITLDPS
ncbi:MAG: transcription factor IIB [Cenarchaeum sp. SB0665_bin_23]|nr:transcription factor IIB [Cenarchaeum sp. SB0667_bin_13]MXY61774.1 transcription factor IIB [Cenarchaeum sp. SB0665_bin_23]MXZ93506.1 transcription factor IIB [Cenarchaeum sp. SB0666_bin_15]MYB46365.1 transcription factor IIB [Cenarchaeum sp. SB0662_bin_33]MYC79856.1 transcription factor IIB [Cenarchaeum sp. SB0661_bin_35]MYD58408.1 transcription factor IIB [Cenarchaeum sp. SB0678_bin_8]MYJ28185.1 transcription factor IIB [Cenarchaeum sp. SB0672_bin_9]